MENKESFDSYIQLFGGTPIQFQDTPFPVFYFEKVDLLIHFIEVEKLTTLQNKDTFLTSWLQTHQPNYTKILHLYSDVWQSKNLIIKNRLHSLLGLNKRVFARQTQVVRIDKPSAIQFLSQHHLQGATSAYYKFGLMHKNNLVAVASFSKARTMYDGPVYYKSYELERFATLSNINVVGGLSKLITHFRNYTHAKHIMTYADRDWSNGAGYEKLGFVAQEFTAPNLFWVDVETNERFWNKEILEPTSKLVSVYNTGSIKYIWDNR